MGLSRYSYRLLTGMSNRAEKTISDGYNVYCNTIVRGNPRLTLSPTSELTEDNSQLTVRSNESTILKASPDDS